MNRDARVQQWEKHLSKIIEQTNKNISSLPVGYPPEPTERKGMLQFSTNSDNAENDKYGSQTGDHYLQAQHVIRGNSMGFVNRSVPKQVEEDLSARVAMNAKRTTEKIVNEKIHSTHIRIDRLNDKVGELSDDGVKIHREYGLLARQLATQERLIKRFKQEYEHQKNLVTKLGEAMANDVGWKESTVIDLKMIKDQMRQDSATCVTTTDMKDALEAITTKTMLAMERSAMSAKLAFESDVALLKQEMSHLKQENEKLKNDLIVTRDASKALTTKLEKGHITTIIANAVESQLQKVEQQVTQSIQSSMKRDFVLVQEKINASVVDKIKDALGREIVHGGGDFHRVISSMIVKAISDDSDIIDTLLEGRNKNDDPMAIESDEDRSLRSRIDIVEKRIDVLNARRIDEEDTKTSSLLIDDVKTMLLPVENSFHSQLTTLEATMKEYCNNNIKSCSSTASNALEQIKSMTPTVMESLDLTQKLGSNMEHLEVKMKEELGILKREIETDFLENINRIESRTEKNEVYLKRNIEHLQNDFSNMKNQLNELERKDFTNLYVDMNALQNSVENLKNNKSYSVEDLASCMGKVTSLENKLRQEMGTLRSEFIDLQGNVFDQNAASSERVELMIQHVQKDIERLGIHRLANASKEKHPPEFISIQNIQDAEDRNELKEIHTSVETLQKRVQDLNVLPGKVESLEEKFSSQGVEFQELSGVLDALQTSFHNYMSADRNNQSCREASLDDATDSDIVVAKKASLNESIVKEPNHSKDSDACLENVKSDSKVNDSNENDRDKKYNDEETQLNENFVESESSDDSTFSSSEKHSKSIHDINSENLLEFGTGATEDDSQSNNLITKHADFQMSDSIEGRIFDADEIESVPTPIEEKSHESNNSDVIYESDFEEFETKEETKSV